MIDTPLPGVFRPLAHAVPAEPAYLTLVGPIAENLGCAGYTVVFSRCGLPCWWEDVPLWPFGAVRLSRFEWCPRCFPGRTTVWR